MAIRTLSSSVATNTAMCTPTNTRSSFNIKTQATPPVGETGIISQKTTSATSLRDASNTTTATAEASPGSEATLSTQPRGEEESEESETESVLGATAHAASGGSNHTTRHQQHATASTEEGTTTQLPPAAATEQHRGSDTVAGPTGLGMVYGTKSNDESSPHRSNDSSNKDEDRQAICGLVPPPFPMTTPPPSTASPDGQGALASPPRDIASAENPGAVEEKDENNNGTWHVVGPRHGASAPILPSGFVGDATRPTSASPPPSGDGDQVLLGTPSTVSTAPSTVVDESSLMLTPTMAEEELPASDDSPSHQRQPWQEKKQQEGATSAMTTPATNALDLLHPLSKGLWGHHEEEGSGLGHQEQTGGNLWGGSNTTTRPASSSSSVWRRQEELPPRQSRTQGYPVQSARTSPPQPAPQSALGRGANSRMHRRAKSWEEQETVGPTTLPLQLAYHRSSSGRALGSSRGALFAQARPFHPQQQQAEAQHSMGRMSHLGTDSAEVAASPMSSPSLSPRIMPLPAPAVQRGSAGSSSPGGSLNAMAARFALQDQQQQNQPYQQQQQQTPAHYYRAFQQQQHLQRLEPLPQEPPQQQQGQHHKRMHQQEMPSYDQQQQQGLYAPPVVQHQHTAAHYFGGSTGPLGVSSPPHRMRQPLPTGPKQDHHRRGGAITRGSRAIAHGEQRLAGTQARPVTHSPGPPPTMSAPSSSRSPPEILKTLLRKKACLYEPQTSRAVSLVTWLIGRELACEYGYFSRQQLQSGVHACVSDKIRSGVITRTKVNRCMQIILNSCFHYVIPRPDGTEEQGGTFRDAFQERAVDDSNLLRELPPPWDGLKVDREGVLQSTGTGDKSDDEDETGSGPKRVSAPSSPENSPPGGPTTPRHQRRSSGDGGAAGVRTGGSSKRTVLLGFNDNVSDASDVYRCHDEFIRDAAHAAHLHLTAREWMAFFGDDGSSFSSSSLADDVPADALGQMKPHELQKFRTTWCAKRYDHDRSLCGFAHVGTNNGWLRRDPTRFHYSPEPCPNVTMIEGGMLDGCVVNTCSRGEHCGYSHSNEEVEYHPGVYKHNPCPHSLGKGGKGGCPLGDVCPMFHSTAATAGQAHGGRGQQQRFSDNSPPRQLLRHAASSGGSFASAHSLHGRASRKGSLGATAGSLSKSMEAPLSSLSPGSSPVLYVHPSPESEYEKYLSLPGLKELYRRQCATLFAHHCGTEIPYSYFGEAGNSTDLSRGGRSAQQVQ